MKVWTVRLVSLHHRRMGTATLLVLRGGVTPPPPSMPSQLGRQRGSGDLNLGQAGGGAQEASRLSQPRPRQAGGAEQGPNLGLTGLDLGSGVFFS
jgi:hypothetical protein